MLWSRKAAKKTAARYDNPEVLPPVAPKPAPRVLTEAEKAEWGMSRMLREPGSYRNKLVRFEDGVLRARFTLNSEVQKPFHLSLEQIDEMIPRILELGKKALRDRGGPIMEDLNRRARQGEDVTRWPYKSADEVPGGNAFEQIARGWYSALSTARMHVENAALPGPDAVVVTDDTAPATGNHAKPVNRGPEPGGPGLAGPGLGGHA